MFTALAVICMIGDINNCESVTNRRIFTTEEACLQDRTSAEVFANSVGRFVLRFECYDWGVST